VAYAITSSMTRQVAALRQGAGSALHAGGSDVHAQSLPVCQKRKLTPKMETLPPTHCAAARLLGVYYLHTFIFQKLEDIDTCTRSLPLALPSVLFGVWAEMGPTFWKVKKCAAFRSMRR
jgi:hypothetical protein